MTRRRRRRRGRAGPAWPSPAPPARPGTAPPPARSARQSSHAAARWCTSPTPSTSGGGRGCSITSDRPSSVYSRSAHPPRPSAAGPPPSSWSSAGSRAARFRGHRPWPGASSNPRRPRCSRRSYSPPPPPSSGGGGGGGGGGSWRAVELSDVFDRIEYLDASERSVETRLCPAGGTVSAPGSPSARGPSEVASSVSDVVNAGLVDDLGPVVEMSSKVPVKMKCPRLTNPVDLAAARLLGPMARAALAECLGTIRSATGGGGDGGVSGEGGGGATELVAEFGALADAAIRRALGALDSASSAQPRFRKSSVARRIRADLRENLYAEVGDLYESQVSALRDATFASFRARLNKLRIGPSLPDQMAEAAESSLSDFASAVKKLRVPRATSYGSWTTNADQISSLRRVFAEHNAERLRAARASGQFRPLPRKGVTVGFHWLLPKPFGNDYRQEPHLTHTSDDLVYAPADGITDVGVNEIRTGDWRRGVVPAPAGGEMMYLK